MPRRRRTSTAGLVFHVVNRAAKRARLFENDTEYASFECVLREAIARSDIELFAYCIMPNHWHLLLSPNADGELSRFMHWLTTTHARRWQTSRGLDGQGAVYQGRFKAIAVECDRHFLRVCRYVERNPVRGLLVERAEDWPRSSLSQRNRKAAAISLAEWPVAQPADWTTLVNRAQTAAEVEAVRVAIRRSEPFGDDQWKEAIRQRLGLPVPRRRGRPPGSRRVTSVSEK
jgi:putative transposase